MFSSRVNLEPEGRMLFSKLVRIEDDKYHVAGGFRIQYNSKYDSQIKVTQQNDTLVRSEFTTYTELPKVMLTYLNFSQSEFYELDIFIKWVYHTNIDVYIGLFDSNAHVEKNAELRNFMKTARFVHRTTNVNHNNIFKLKAVLEVVYFSIDEYNRCFLSERDDDHVLHHHDLTSFKLVVYLTPSGATTDAHEAIKIVPITL